MKGHFHNHHTKESAFSTSNPGISMSAAQVVIMSFSNRDNVKCCQILVLASLPEGSLYSSILCCNSLDSTVLHFVLFEA